MPRSGKTALPGADGTPVTLTSYFEGDDDEAPVTLTGRYPRGGLRLPGGRAYGDGRRHPPAG